MSVRKVYSVTVNGVTVYTGSYAMCMAAYEAIDNIRERDVFAFLTSEDFVVSVSFSPDIKRRD